MIQTNLNNKCKSIEEVLASNLLPPKMEDGYLKDVVKAISLPNTLMFKKIIEAIFKSINLVSLDRD